MPAVLSYAKKLLNSSLQDYGKGVPNVKKYSCSALAECQGVGSQSSPCGARKSSPDGPLSLSLLGGNRRSAGSCFP
ncbi:hypothetical protein GN956_G20539 [Arapaima gigas]